MVGVIAAVAPPSVAKFFSELNAQCSNPNKTVYMLYATSDNFGQRPHRGRLSSEEGLAVSNHRLRKRPAPATAKGGRT